MNTLQKRRWTYIWVATLALLGVYGYAQKNNYISYLGAAWGPDGDTVYCIKRTIGNRFWFCKMKWDGSAKEDICEFWLGQNARVDTQNGPLWMEMNAATSNVAFSVEYGNEVSFGLWVMSLDGKNLHRPFPLIWDSRTRWAPLHPSWSPDGTRIVYEEEDRNSPESSVTRLVLFDLRLNKRTQLTAGPCDEHPVWSPKGDWIAFTHNLYDQSDRAYSDRRIWLIRPDGSELKPVLDRKGKTIFGWWPSWNPEGTRVSINTGLLVLADVTSNKTERLDPLYIMGVRSPYLLMGHHWGKRGWLWIGGSIIFVDANTRKAWMIEGEKPVELHGKEREPGAKQ
jgi:hypothetical protein